MMKDSIRNMFAGKAKAEPEIGSKASRLAGIKNISINDAVRSKLVESMLPTAARKNGDDRISPPAQYAQAVVNKTASNLIDNENMLQLLPDMELAMQVLISSILSPNNMTSSELTIGSAADDLGDIKALLLDIISTYFKEVYKINTILPEMLEEMLFKSGSYPLAILPESSIDAAINGKKRVTTETINLVQVNGKPKSLGVLGNIGKSNRLDFGLESMAAGIVYDPIATVGVESIIISDNVDLLKFPQVHERMISDRLSSVYASKAMGMEDNKDNVESFIYPRRDFGFNPVLNMRTLDELEGDTIGHPLVLHLPPESIIPVHVPSEPKKHIGYFIAVDKHGNPIRANTNSDFYGDFAHNTDMLKDMSTQLLAQTRRASEGKRDNVEMMLDEAMQMYTEVMERELKGRLSNGLYGENVTVARPTEVYRIMLARACAKMQTQLIYVPVTLMTYMAFDFNEYGVGKSLLETTKILGSVRAMMLFANTIGAIKNSTNHTDYTLDLDPDDPDPGRSIELFAHEISKSKQSAYPIGASNPLDIVNYIQNSATSIIPQNHPNWPGTKVSISDRQSSRALIDNDLDESLKKRHLMSIGIAPETVDLSMNVEFAQSIISSNILLAKRAMVHQKSLTALIADFIMKYTSNSSTLYNAIKACITNNKSKLKGGKHSTLTDDNVTKYFISSITTSLPEPDLSRIEIQKTAFEAYSEALDAVIPAFISSELFDSSIFGELNSTVDVTIAVIKAHYQRRWLQSNDMLPEMFEILDQDKDGNPTFDLLKSHEGYMDGLGASLITFMKRALTSSGKRDEAMNKIREATGADEPPADDGGGGEDTNADAGGDELDAGGDDLDFGGDGGGEDEVVEEVPVEEEEPPAEEPEEEPKEEDTKDEDKKEEDKKEE